MTEQTINTGDGSFHLAIVHGDNFEMWETRDDGEILIYRAGECGVMSFMLKPNSEYLLKGRAKYKLEDLDDPEVQARIQTNFREELDRWKGTAAIMPD